MNYLDYVYILTPVLLAIITNGIIYGLGWNDTNNYTTNDTYSLLPPGWMIGMIWIIIFGFLGKILQLTVKSRDYVSLVLISILIIICLAYPFYTNGLKMNNISLLGDTITLIYAFSISLIMLNRTQNKSMVYYMIPILVWCSYVNIVDSLRK